MGNERSSALPESSSNSNAFREAMRRFATTVSIISCVDHDGCLHGMSVTAVTSVSIEPPALLVCVNNAAATHRALSNTCRFCLNILRSHHSELSHMFSGKLRGGARFRLGDWDRAPDGLPFLLDAQANLFCEVDRRIRYETHTIFVGRVYSAKLQDQIDPLVYQDGRYSVALPVARP